MSHAVEEYYRVYGETPRRARKPHVCDACLETVPARGAYTAVFLVHPDGRTEALKRCSRCQTIHEHLRTLAPADMWPDERLQCGMDYEEEWGPLPPEMVAAAFALPGGGP